MDVPGLWGALHPLGYRFPQLMRLTNSQSKEEGRKKHFTGLLSLSVHPKERLLGWYLEGKMETLGHFTGQWDTAQVKPPLPSGVIS